MTMMVLTACGVVINRQALMVVAHLLSEPLPASLGGRRRGCCIRPLLGQSELGFNLTVMMYHARAHLRFNLRA